MTPTEVKRRLFFLSGPLIPAVLGRIDLQAPESPRPGAYRRLRPCSRFHAGRGDEEKSIVLVLWKWKNLKPGLSEQQPQ